MRLDSYLVEHFKLSRSRAKLLIEDGAVLINEIVFKKPNKTVLPTDAVVVNDTINYVSRAGLKLEHALKLFSINTINKNCLDIGSSTGGFTDCLLKNGAAHVDAVDVGTDQLVEKLRNDSRVSVYEKTDIRNFETNNTYDLIVCDASFISLTKIIPVVPHFSKKNADIILLIKPQFEVGREFLGKGGIVNDEMRVVEVITDIVNLAKKNDLRLIDEIKICPLKGGDGNQEYIAYFTYLSKSV